MALDPVTALSVAAAVVQFVEFGSKLVLKGVEAYNAVDGALIENAEIERAAARLTALSERLGSSLLPDFQGRLSDRDQTLETICKSCVMVSSQLIAHLNKLKVPAGQQHRKWRSFRMALKSVCSKDDLNGIAGKLEALKNELETHVLVALRQQVSSLSVRNNEQYNVLDEGIRSTINTLLQQSITIDHISTQLGEMMKSNKTEHTLSRSVFMSQNTQNRNRRVELSFLESLKFATIGDRYSAVAEAHQKTFQWIFKDREDTTNPRATFSDWLKTGTTVFWIQGKAGSGKSTLMRFIMSHPKVLQHLNFWSGHGTCNTAGFFFWKGGVEEQRSSVGLLRSLIWEVLSSQESLISRIFPEDWDRLCALEEHGLPLTLNTWTLSRLKLAFQNLVSQANEQFKLCFFIDGIDELEGEQSDISSILSFLRSFESSAFVKFCVSSRPWPVFSQYFEKFPGLKLQDLTKGDIELYVQDKLNKDEMMLLLLRAEPRMATQLTKDIVGKADGVFLWVRLVVKSLLNGLINEDGIIDLRKRLARLPPDLESLYAHMLGSIEEIYMEEASKIFQLHHACLKCSRDLSIPILDIALKCKAQDPLRKIFQAIKDADTSSGKYYKQYTKKLQSRCGGLLETQVSIYGLKVQYLHRTVADYLESPRVRQKLLGYTVTSGFEPYESLLKSSVLMLNKEQLARNQVRSYFAHRWWDNVIPFAIHGELIDGNDQVILLDEVDRLLSEGVAIDDMPGKDRPSSQRWLREFFPPIWETDMLSFAVSRGLCTYVKTKLTSHPSLIREKRQPPLLAYALQWIDMRNKNNSSKMVHILLEHGADPNELYFKHTMWEYSIHYAHTRGDGFQNFPWAETQQQWQEIFGLMLQHGADPGACCLDDCNAWRIIYRDRPQNYSNYFASDDDIDKFLIRAEKTSRNFQWI